MSRRAPGVAAGLGAVAVLLAACDDQLKYVPWFESMSQQAAFETYEEAPRPAPEGAVPIDGEPTYTLLEADTALANPLRATSENVARGRVLYGQFCTPCHGDSGRGDGPVMLSEARPRGVPYTPAMDLQADAARARSDGFVWGIIGEGRGLMPPYRRIPRLDRWHLVLYVRHLQQTGGEAEAADRRAGGDAAGGGAEAGGESAAPAAGEGR